MLGMYVCVVDDCSFLHSRTELDIELQCGQTDQVPRPLDWLTMGSAQQISPQRHLVRMQRQLYSCVSVNCAVGDQWDVAKVFPSTRQYTMFKRVSRVSARDTLKRYPFISLAHGPEGGTWILDARASHKPGRGNDLSCVTQNLCNAPLLSPNEYPSRAPAYLGNNSLSLHLVVLMTSDRFHPMSTRIRRTCSPFPPTYICASCRPTIT